MKRLLVTSLALGLLAPGCKSSRSTGRDLPTSRIVISEIDIVHQPGGDGAPLIDTKHVLALVEAKIRHAPALVRQTAQKGEPVRTGYRLEVTYGTGEREDDAGKREFVAIAAARAKPVTADPQGSDDRPVLELAGASPAPATLPKGNRRELLEKTLARVLDAVAAQAALAVGDDQAVLSALGTKSDVDTLLFALDQAARRRLKRAIKPAIALLTHGERQVADRAIGTLVRLRAREAVKALTRVAKFRDARRMAQLIDAIGMIGGEEAKQYLEFVAQGHAYPVIRDQARAALDRMKSAQKKP